VEEYRSPAYATAVGLVLEGNIRSGKTAPASPGEGAIREKGMWDALMDWFKKEIF
jgi:hypothetical protein